VDVEEEDELEGSGITPLSLSAGTPDSFSVPSSVDEPSACRVHPVCSCIWLIVMVCVRVPLVVALRPLEISDSFSSGATCTEFALPSCEAFDDLLECGFTMFSASGDEGTQGVRRCRSRNGSSDVGVLLVCCLAASSELASSHGVGQVLDVQLHASAWDGSSSLTTAYVSTNRFDVQLGNFNEDLVRRALCLAWYAPVSGMIPVVLANVGACWLARRVGVGHCWSTVSCCAQPGPRVRRCWFAGSSPTWLPGRGECHCIWRVWSCKIRFARV
jgi:hypothetical protein